MFDGLSREEILQKVRLLRHMIEEASVFLSDTDALSVPELYPKWKAGVTYTLDAERSVRVRYNGLLYRLEQTHTSQEGWEPDITPALWTRVAEPGEIPVWVQPTGAQDAYMTGDKVHYPTAEDPIYVCTSDYNVYAPGVFGWELFEG